MKTPMDVMIVGILGIMLGAYGIIMYHVGTFVNILTPNIISSVDFNGSVCIIDYRR